MTIIIIVIVLTTTTTTTTIINITTTIITITSNTPLIITTNILIDHRHFYCNCSSNLDIVNKLITATLQSSNGGLVRHVSAHDPLHIER